jgi:hypothetical protein
MKVTIYINQKDFDTFFKWVKELELGNLSTPPVKFSNNINDVDDPLRVSLDSNTYFIIKDAQDDLEEIVTLTGPFKIQYEHDTKELHLQRIKEGLRNAKRQNLENELIYTAFGVIKDLPSITIEEAVVIAEKIVLKNS